MRPWSLILFALFLLVGQVPAAEPRPIVVGSKNFPESYILAEVMAQLLEQHGYPVERKFGLGGTLIGFEALRTGGIDVYVEYTGTLEQAILKVPHPLTIEELRTQLRNDFAMDLLEPFGFNNTYALAVSRNTARRLGIRTISDLRRFPDMRLGFSHDFLERADCWPKVTRLYDLPGRPAGIEHALAYLAMHEGKLDVTDVYATDGDIEKFDLMLLEDDRGCFPKYLAAPLVRGDLDPDAKAVLNALAGKIDDRTMTALNAQVVIEQKSFGEIAAGILVKQGLSKAGAPAGPARWTTLAVLIGEHLKLTFIALLASIVVAIPLGILVYRMQRIAKGVIYVAGILQTVPSLALLALMIPLLGTGVVPAIVALFLYSLLPILRNTAVALFTVDPILKKVSVGMGLTAWQRLRYVELPLAGPGILSGIKTAAVINIGTATLATYIGAGGLGYLIATGLQTKNTALIWEGAIPAALLAILTEWGFELLEALVVPRHLLQKPAE
jgi:osmoprotectant transport system permease protein